MMPYLFYLSSTFLTEILVVFVIFIICKFQYCISSFVKFSLSLNELHGRSSGARKVCCAWLIVFCSVTDPLDVFECVSSWSAYMLSCILSFHLQVPYLSAWCKACEWMDVSAAQV